MVSRLGKTENQIDSSDIESLIKTIKTLAGVVGMQFSVDQEKLKMIKNQYVKSQPVSNQF